MRTIAIRSRDRFRSLGLLGLAWTCLVVLGIAWLLRPDHGLLRGIGAELALPT